MKLITVNKNNLRDIEGMDFRPLFRKYVTEARDIGFLTETDSGNFFAESINDENSLVIIGIEAKEPVGYAICRIEYRPRFKISECVIWQMVNISDAPERIEVFGYIEKWAKEKGCKIVRINSFRRGMGKFIDDFGYKLKYSVFEKQLKGGN